VGKVSSGPAQYLKLEAKPHEKPFLDKFSFENFLSFYLTLSGPGIASLVVQCHN
jgi:hypothetical protein